MFYVTNMFYPFYKWSKGDLQINFSSELNEEKIILKRYIQTGLKALVDQLKIWLERNKVNLFMPIWIFQFHNTKKRLL